MLERLAEAIEELRVPTDVVGLAAALVLLDRLTAKVVAAVGSFDAAGGWEAEGATSATAWLRHHGGMAGRQAAGMVRTARVLRRLPATAAAWDQGRLSGGQVQAVRANVRPATMGLLAGEESSVVSAVAGLSVAETAVAMQHWARRADALVDDGEPREGERSLHVSTTLGGRVEVSGSLDPEGGAVVAAAVRVASTRDVDGEPARTPAERRADALVDVCRWFLDHQQGGRGVGGAPTSTSSSTSATSTHGTAAAWSTGPPSTPRPSTGSCATRRCTASSPPGGRPSSTTARRPGRCRRRCGPPWSCGTGTAGSRAGDRPPGWCDAHHVVPVAAGGRADQPTTSSCCAPPTTTAATNPAGTPSFRPDATLEVTTPAGHVLTSRPPTRPPRLPARPRAGDDGPPPSAAAAA